MKTFFKTILIFSIITISCSESGADSSNIESQLIGFWNRNRQVDVCSDSTEDAYEYDECGKEGGYLFKDDGTIETIDMRMTADGCVEKELQGEGGASSGTWEIRNKMLTLVLDGQEFVSDIEIVNDTLKLVHVGGSVSPCNDGIRQSSFLEFLRRIE